MTNTLWYGDNLRILRDEIPSDSVDLIYLDPPFNSNRNYNVLFREKSGESSPAQIQAFTDTWTWDQAAVNAYDELLTEAPYNVSTLIGAMRQFVGANDMMAYLVMMAQRLVELHRVLKPTGSIYLHCDPTASHYLKMLMDAIFGVRNFRNEIVWQRTLAKGNASTRFPNNHDVILYYSRNSQPTWNRDAVYNPYDPAELSVKTQQKYSHVDSNGRRYQLDNLINPASNRPNLTYEFLGVTRVWRWTRERMQQAFEDGLVVQTSPGRVPRLKRYLDEQEGLPIPDTWTDINPINSQAKERLGYPTQKPLALLERIIEASSNPGDVVLDPFCGCGTAVVAAQKLGRQWIGIDITHLAVALMKNRLIDMFGDEVEFQVRGLPEDVGAAEALALQDRYEFQYWANSLVNAQPIEGREKKGADGGIDGVIRFIDDDSGKAKRVIVSVKSGKVQRTQVADLIQAMNREKADMCLFITLQPSTKPMRDEALSAGKYESPWWGDFPRCQILTIEELLSGKQPEMPPMRATFDRAQRVRKVDQHQNAILPGMDS